MKELASGPVHTERITQPYCWTLRYDEGNLQPYVVHRKIFSNDGSYSYMWGHYFKDLNKALLKWLDKISTDIHRNVNEDLE